VLRRRRLGRPVFPRDGRNRRNLLGAIVFGGIVGPVLLLVGLQHALAASVSMWLNLEAVATAVLAFLFFREHVGKWTWLGSLGVVAAGMLLSYDAGRPGWVGLLLVAGASLAWGLDNNFTAVIDGINPEDSTFWKGLIAGTTNLVIGIVFFPWRLGEGWLWALVLGGLSYGASIVLYIRAAQALGATRAQLVFASAPFFGVLLAVLWLREDLSALQLVAAGVLALAIGLIFRDRHGHVHEHAALTHEHEHRHDDQHHDHQPGEVPGTGAHAHVHEHAPLTHAHPHWPDLHHRHHGR
jgi:drug/metabolite transporter (DMT)-like permease